MVDDDDGWSLIAVWLIGLESVFVTDGSDSVTGTDSGTTVSTTGFGIAFCGELVVLGLCDVRGSGSLFRGGLFEWFRSLLLLVN